METDVQAAQRPLRNAACRAQVESPITPSSWAGPPFIEPGELDVVGAGLWVWAGPDASPPGTPGSLATGLPLSALNFDLEGVLLPCRYIHLPR